MINFKEPIEVTKEQYTYLMRRFAGAIAGRTEDGKYWIWVWAGGVIPAIEKYLKSFKAE